MEAHQEFLVEQRTEPECLPIHPSLGHLYSTPRCHQNHQAFNLWATLLHPQDITHQVFNPRFLYMRYKQGEFFLFHSSAFLSYLYLHSAGPGCAVDQPAESEGLFLQHIIQCLPVGLHM